MAERDERYDADYDHAGAIRQLVKMLRSTETNPLMQDNLSSLQVHGDTLAAQVRERDATIESMGAVIARLELAVYRLGEGAMDNGFDEKWVLDRTQHLAKNDSAWRDWLADYVASWTPSDANDEEAE